MRKFWLYLCISAVFGFKTLYAETFVSNDEPVLLLADEVSHDKEFDRTIAEGNVEISQGNEVVKADRIVYQHKEDLITATGNVHMTRPDNSRYSADYIELTGDFKKGTAHALKVFMTKNGQNMRFASNDAEFFEDKSKVFRKGVYSPCHLCKEDPEKSPLWQMKARKIVHDPESGTVSYRDARLEFFGIPLAYTPYLAHADPGTKRKSGFLNPYYKQTSKLQTAFFMPYYLVLNDSAEMLFTPAVSTNGRKVLSHRFRWLIPYGEIDMISSGAYTKFDRYEASLDKIKSIPLKDPKHFKVERKALDHKFDAHQFWKMRLHMNETWRFGLDYKHATDKFYLKNYFSDYSNFLLSETFLDGFWEHDYFTYRMQKFQGLRPGDDPQLAERLLPMMAYNMFRDLDEFGSLRFDSIYRNLARDKGPQSQLVSLRPSWEKRVLLNGFVLKGKAAIRGDVFKLKVEDPLSSKRFNGTVLRPYSELALVSSYPLLFQGGEHSFIAEPILGVLSTPHGQNRRHKRDLIPKDDSQGFEFTENKLFHANMFQGYDRVGEGSRIDYAFKTQYLYKARSVIDAILGQVYQFSEPRDFLKGSGLDHKKSDYVFAANFNPLDELTFYNRMRIKPTNRRLRRNEIGVTAGPSRIQLTTSYVHLRGNPNKEDDPFSRQHQLLESISLGITPRLFLKASAVHNINRKRIYDINGVENVKFKRKKTLTHSLGLEYNDECFLASVRVTKTLTKDKKIDRHQAMFNIGFKTLGL